MTDSVHAAKIRADLVKLRSMAAFLSGISTSNVGSFASWDALRRYRPLAKLSWRRYMVREVSNDEVSVMFDAIQVKEVCGVKDEPSKTSVIFLLVS